MCARARADAATLRQSVDQCHFSSVLLLLLQQLHLILELLLLDELCGAAAVDECAGWRYRIVDVETCTLHCRLITFDVLGLSVFRIQCDLKRSVCGFVNVDVVVHVGDLLGNRNETQS